MPPVPLQPTLLSHQWADLNHFFGPLNVRDIAPRNSLSVLALAFDSSGYYVVGAHYSADATVQ